ncbi:MULTISPECIES: hypothetical protein [Bradyrhizobium]|nr:MULTISPECIES: hypothetical protein [Bradyrhizobium]
MRMTDEAHGARVQVGAAARGRPQLGLTAASKALVCLSFLSNVESSMH